MEILLTPEQEKRLRELRRMTPKQWESLCKRCGLCCICKYGIPNKVVFYTDVRCDALNPKTKECTIYKKRFKINGNNCRKVDLDAILTENIVPRTCGYVEYIFGPAPFKISVDWEKMISEKVVDMNDPITVYEHLIMESRHWNQR